MKYVERGNDRRWRFIAFVVLAAAFWLATACSGPSDDDPNSCNYESFDMDSAGYSAPTLQEVEGFTYFILARAESNRDSGTGKLSTVSVTETVHGTAEQGSKLDVYSEAGICLEAGRDYYLLASDSTGPGDLSVVPSGIFPVINNRITLSQEFRKDQVIGRFHGLDSVLFKRRLIEFVDRSDIVVD
jgi:hypothetical protein